MRVPIGNVKSLMIRSVEPVLPLFLNLTNILVALSHLSGALVTLQCKDINNCGVFVFMF